MMNMDLPGNYCLERAEKSLFAVYQALYSNADTEMWYDWNMRVNDTMWSEDGYFLTHKGRKLAGAIVQQNRFLYPFLVAPFCDRALFYRLLHGAIWAGFDGVSGGITAHDVLDEDVEVLLTMGYQRTLRIRRVMVRPTDRLLAALPPGFEMAVPEPGMAAEITAIFHQAFSGGVHAQEFGPHRVEDTDGCFERYQATGTLDVSSVIYESATYRMVGACLAGLDPNAVNGFAGIADVGVLPGYQNRGLGAWMIQHALNQAHQYAPVMKLVVTVGSPAESLYRRLGFLPGPRFTKMVFRC